MLPLYEAVTSCHCIINSNNCLNFQNLVQDMVTEVDSVMDIMSTGCIEKFRVNRVACHQLCVVSFMSWSFYHADHCSI